MIFHDSVRVVMEVSFDPPQYNEYGEEIMDHVEQMVPAEVFALDTDAVLSQTSERVISRYRMVLAPTVDIPADIGNGLRIEWGPFVIEAGYPTTGLRVDGTVERHMLRGRLHHYELITKSVMG
jgi:hypothetical protein